MAKVVIFRRIVEEINHLNNSIYQKEMCAEDAVLEKEKRNALLNILRYAVHEKWKWTGSKSKKKILMFIKNGCDYYETAKNFNAKSINSIEVTISNLGKKFEKAIGSHTIDLILQGLVDEAMITARTGVGDIDLNSYFLHGFPKYLPKSTKERIHFKIEDCQKEIKLLAFFTKYNVEQFVNGFNPEKLSYLIHILSSTDKIVSTERQVLNQLFNGVFSGNKLSRQVEIALEQIQERDISRNIL